MIPGDGCEMFPREIACGCRVDWVQRCGDRVGGVPAYGAGGGRGTEDVGGMARGTEDLEYSGYYNVSDSLSCSIQ